MNGKLVQTHTSSKPITSLGLRPHRAKMRLYSWTVTMDTGCSGATKGVYKDTIGNCRGGTLRWPAGVPTAAQQGGNWWNCIGAWKAGSDMTNPMDIGRCSGDCEVHTKASCQAACDVIDICGGYNCAAVPCCRALNMLPARTHRLPATACATDPPTEHRVTE